MAIPCSLCAAGLGHATLTTMLFGIALALVVACVAGAVLAGNRAPSAALALIGGVSAGLVGLYVAARHDPTGVPADVAVWATGGFVALGLIGLLVTPKGSAPGLRRAAVLVSALAPFAAAALGVSLLYACPLYVTEGAGFCVHEIDVLGGWISEVVLLFVLDSAALVVLLLVSAKLARA
jgi:hypothetical protein